MPAYSQNNLKHLGVFVTILVCSSVLFAESIEMPVMPDFPQMSDSPEVSAPVINDTFYTPGLPSRVSPPAKTETQTQSPLISSETVLTEATSPDDLLTELLKSNSTLTAKDISSLYGSGLFSSISSLGENNLTSSGETTVLLQQVLKELNELKANQKKVSEAEKENQKTQQEDSENFKKREPKVLRFKINGFNIADSLTTVFFSEPESDGTFLFTADRKYFADKKTRTETFYFIFRAVNTTGNSVIYEVEPSLVQDYENKNSFLYRLTKSNSLKAEKTGNLVVLRSSDDLKVDMLLKLDN